MVSRRVRCRSGRSRAPPVRSGSRRSRRASIAWGVSTFPRAAASSIASGRPSRRRQISATAAAFSSVSAKSGRTSMARWTKRATAGYTESSSAGSRRPASGTGSGGTGCSCSPRRCSAARLVTTTLRPAQAPSSSAMAGAGGRICSKLSSRSSRRFSRTCSFKASSTGRLPTSRTPTVCAIVETTSAGSLIGASSTKKTPSSYAWISSAATCTPSLVLPVPPGPVSVTSRTSSRLSSPCRVPTSRCRPINGVGWIGKLCGRAFSETSGGNSDGRSGAMTWKTRSGRVRSFRRCAPRPCSVTSFGRSSRTSTAVASESRTWPPCPIPRILAQRLTAAPCMAVAAPHSECSRVSETTVWETSSTPSRTLFNDLAASVKRTPRRAISESAASLVHRTTVRSRTWLGPRLQVARADHWQPGRRQSIFDTPFL